MKSLAKENSHKVTVEAYVGTYYKHEIKKIAKYVDRLLVHVYVKKPKEGLKFAYKRLEYLTEIKKMPKISILYSSEILYMGGWLKYNSIKRGERIFIDSLRRENRDLLRQINFTDFTYYNYNYLAKSINFYKRRRDPNFDRKIKRSEQILVSK